MRVYKLYNLDLGKNPVLREFRIGPYDIKLKEDYDNIQKLLSSQINETEEGEITSDGVSIEKIEEIPAKVGEPLVTATATCIKEEDARLSNAKTEGIWDLCLISSYLLGRRVFIEEDKRRFKHINHGLKIIQEQLFVNAANTAWTNISNFESEKEMLPLWYYLHMNDTPEADLKTLLGCVSLEIIQNIETRNDAINISSELDELIKTIKRDIDGSKIDKNKKSDLKTTVERWGKSSSSEKFRHFLIRYGIIDDEIAEISKDRVDCINKLRNGIVHSGELKKPRWIKDDKTKTEVALFYAGQFIPALIEEYLNRKFGLKDFNWCQQTFEHLKEYIKDGIWDGDEIEQNS